MTAESPQPPPSAGPSLNKSILVAGLLGGLFGALASFALARTFPAVPKPPPTPPPSEARQFADHVVGKWKEGRNDEFKALLRPAFAQMSNEDFAEFCRGLFERRANAPQSYGPGGEFEFLHESTPNSPLVRVTYVEKYARSCVIWLLVVYNTPEGWQMSAFSVQSADSGFPALR